MFHAWMKWLTLDRTYPSEEENAKRLEIFKETLKRVESVYAGAGKSSPSPHLPNLFADRTEEEWRAMTHAARSTPSSTAKNKRLCISYDGGSVSFLTHCILLLDISIPKLSAQWLSFFWLKCVLGRS